MQSVLIQIQERSCRHGQQCSSDHPAQANSAPLCPGIRRRAACGSTSRSRMNTRSADQIDAGDARDKSKKPNAKLLRFYKKSRTARQQEKGGQREEPVPNFAACIFGRDQWPLGSVLSSQRMCTGALHLLAGAQVRAGSAVATTTSVTPSFSPTSLAA